MGIIKNQTEVRAIREAGRITGELLRMLGEMLKPGISTVELETAANRFLAQHRSTAPFKSFDGFNHAICVSLNEEIVNGPPSRERLLEEGDLVSIATAAEHRGLHAKVARTWHIGSDPADDIRRLLTGTDEVIASAITTSVHAKTLDDLIRTIPQTAEKYGLTVFDKLGGCGIGKKLHENPYVPNSPEWIEETVNLQAGLAFTVMPMFSLGDSPEFEQHPDGWTYISRDGALNAHFADTLMMSEDGLINLTADAGR